MEFIIKIVNYRKKTFRTEGYVNVFSKFQGLIDYLGKKLKNKNKKQCLVTWNLKWDRWYRHGKEVKVQNKNFNLPCKVKNIEKNNTKNPSDLAIWFEMLPLKTEKRKEEHNSEYKIAMTYRLFKCVKKNRAKEKLMK